MTDVLGRCLSRPVVVRWNSLFSSLEQIYDLRGKIAEVNQLLNIRTPLRDSDFHFIDEYLTCLTPVAETIDTLHGEKQCFYGYLLPNIISLCRKLQIIIERRNLEYCQVIAEDLVRNLERRFKDFFEIEGNGQFAAVAAVLQPEFKVPWARCLSLDAQARVKQAAMKIAKKASESAKTLQSNDENPPRVADDDHDFGEDDEIFESNNTSLEKSTTELQM